MANCYYFNFEVNAAFPAVCFFHAVKQIELFAKLLFGIYKYMFYRLRKFLLSKEATSHFPRNNLYILSQKRSSSIFGFVSKARRLFLTTGMKST